MHELQLEIKWDLGDLDCGITVGVSQAGLCV